MTTFEECWRAVKLHATLVDPLMCRKWVEYAYKELCDRYPWHFLYAETILSVAEADTRTGLTVTQDSTTVLDASAVATDQYRQFRVGNGPIYTIRSVTVATSYVLDQAYAADTDANATAVLSDRYVRTPADFGSWDTVVDLNVQRPILTGYSQVDLLALDPARTQSQEPRILVDLDIDADNRVRYEWWPHPTSARQYPALYKRRPTDLADTYTFPGVLGDRQDILVEGALLQAAKWPGTPEHRNPYFVLGLHDRLSQDWDRKVHTLGLRDDDQALRSWATFPWHEWRESGLSSTQHLRSSDATVYDYF